MLYSIVRTAIYLQFYLKGLIPVTEFILSIREKGNIYYIICFVAGMVIKTPTSSLQPNSKLNLLL